MIVTTEDSGIKVVHNEPVSQLSLMILNDEHENDLQMCLSRALNTWDKAPKWLLQLSDLLENRIKARNDQN